MRIRADDALAGAVFICVGTFAVVYSATQLRIGVASDMGAGYFPLALGGILAILGGLIALKGLNGIPVRLGSVPWRPLLLLAAAPIVFGLTVRGLGLVPCIFLTTTLAAFARRETRGIHAILTGAGITILIVGIFSYGLGVPQPLFGSWFSRW